MNIYVYSDESGVFDKLHNDTFVFGGLILLETAEKEKWSRQYSKAERDIRKTKKVSMDYELKSTKISNKEKSKLFRSLNGCYKFGGIINQKQVLERIFNSKKDKQRYLDYVYKIAVKRAFEKLIDDKVISPESVKNIYFYVDEHSTATNGRYELREALEQEFKNGTYNFDYSTFHKPIFPNVSTVDMTFCNSKNKLLIRASDIVANRIFYLSQNDKEKLNTLQNLVITRFP